MTGLALPRRVVEPAQLATALDQLERLHSVEKYVRLQALAGEIDVSQSREFQKLFTHYYRAGRRKPTWYLAFFRLFEAAKHMTQLSFERLLREMHERSGHVEVSFVSKMLATLRPDEPVIDSILLGHMQLKVPYPYERDRLQKCVDLHRDLRCALERLLESRGGREAINAFDRRLPTHASDVSKIKKLDLMLWQLR